MPQKILKKITGIALLGIIVTGFVIGLVLGLLYNPWDRNVRGTENQPFPYNKTLPQIATVNTAGTTMNLAIRGNLLAVADGSNGLLIYDLADITSPVLKHQFSTAAPAENVILYGTWIIGLTLGEGIAVYDVSDPEKPIS